MSETIKGWDTIGVTNFSMMADKRIAREFTGTDGQKRNIFVPAESIAPEIANLVALFKKATDTGALGPAIGTEVSGKFMLGLKRISLGSDAGGSEFMVLLETGDGLQLRFLLNRSTMETLATAVAVVAAKHGMLTTAGQGTVN